MLVRFPRCIAGGQVGFAPQRKMSGSFCSVTQGPRSQWHHISKCQTPYLPRSHFSTHAENPHPSRRLPVPRGSTSHDRRATSECRWRTGKSLRLLVKHGRNVGWSWEPRNASSVSLGGHSHLLPVIPMASRCLRIIFVRPGKFYTCTLATGHDRLLWRLCILKVEEKQTDSLYSGNQRFMGDDYSEVKNQTKIKKSHWCYCWQYASNLIAVLYETLPYHFL